MHSLSEQGIDRKIYEKYFGDLTNVKCEAEPFMPVEFAILKTVFIMLAIGCGLAIILLLIEFGFHYVPYFQYCCPDVHQHQ